MIIKDIFEKKIDRDIRGVIKVDKGTGTTENEVSEREALEKQELEEYVVTNELQKHFASFFYNYKKGITDNTDKMGVWISGFFGSGKSHFLKTLAHLLANKEVAGKRAIDYFKEGNKISDPMVLADMELAANTSTDVILFNVDSKGESSGKQSKDAIVNVFLRAFNEMQGFCGSEPFIADLERRLVNEGKYDEFVRIFEEESGTSWIEERNSPIFIQDELCAALTGVGLMSEDAARNFCEKSTEPYSISIEDFSKMVQSYIKKKGNNHHVVFLVDEIGQYIADDSKLMLNLQTVTEDLGSACKGKAWVIVTSQQDIDSVTKTKGNDFSKIQGRFDTRLSLSSANADEVIRKRILEKNETGAQSLRVLYEAKGTSIKNKIEFNDGIEKKLYSDADNFAAVYPFVPYQFNLSGSVLTAIRTYSSSGKHMADGERSLLALFKESAMSIKDNEIGALVPFNMFYEPIREFIDHSHSIVIKRAYDNEFINPDHEENCFAVNVLKVLFMIKYVKEIKSNVENITSLMVSHVDEDRLELKNKVEAALKSLVKQTCVQKSGENYVFLTNEEQEINRAVEAQAIDPAEKTSKISELIFDGICDIKKYKHPALNGRYSFNINLIVDDKPYKAVPNCPISLKIITPNSGDSTDEMTLRLASGQSNSVIVALPDDRAFLDELTLALQIEKFIIADSSNSVTKYEHIKADKKVELRDHNDNAKLYLSESLRNADIYVNGSTLQTSAKDPTTRILEAIGKLVSNTYHKLTYIDTAMGESDINELFSKNNQIAIDGMSVTPNQLALNEMEKYISTVQSQHTKISMKTLAAHFYAAPYGFNEADVQWLVAKLFKSGSIALWVNNEAVTVINRTTPEIIRFITRKEYLEKLMIEKKEVVNEKYVKAAKEVSKELFGVSITSDDDDSIMADFQRYAGKLKNDIDVLLAGYTDGKHYPGKTVLQDGKAVINSVLECSFANEFYKTVYDKKDDMLDLAEDIEPVKKFFAGEQKNIFDKALDYLAIYEESKIYIANKEIEDTTESISKIIRSVNPYNQIHQLPGLLEKFAELNVALLKELAEPILISIEEAKSRVFEKLDGRLCREKLSEKYVNAFEELRRKAKTCNNVAKLQNIKIEADTLKIRCLDEIDTEEAKLIPKPPLPNNGGDSYGSEDITSSVVTKKHKNISIKSLNHEASWEIESEADIDKYLESLRKQIKCQLEENTVVRIEF